MAQQGSVDWAAEAAKFGGKVASVPGPPGTPDGPDWGAEAAKFGGVVQPASTPAGLPAPSAQPGGPPTPVSLAVSHQVAGAPPKPAFLSEVASNLSPFNRKGRRNLAGGVGGAIGGALSLESGGWGAVPGAAAGGAAMEAIEKWTRGEPLTVLPGTNADSSEGSILGAGAEQAVGELGGQAAMWPLRAFGRRAIAPIVRNNAFRALQSSRAATEATLDTAVSQADRTLDLTKQQALDRLDQVGQRLDMSAPKIGNQQAGRLAHDVVTGPAKSFKDKIGGAVEEVSKRAKPIAVQPLRDRLRELAEQITPAVSHEQTASIPGYSPAQVAAIAKNNPTLNLSVPADHPLPGMLDKIRQVITEADEIPHYEGHKIKRLLDDAVNWESPARKQVQQITKAFRQTVRDSLAADKDYNSATAAYQSISQAYGSKSLARQLQSYAQDAPEDLIKRIKPDQPTKLQALKEILLQHAEAGGGKDQGASAWNAVRAAWTHQHVIGKGPEKLLDSIGKIDPDFLATMYDDAEGKTVLGNLQQIGQAYQKAIQTGAAEVSTAKSGLKGAKAARSAANAPTAEETKFAGSSLNKIGGGDQTAVDFLKVLTLGPGTTWGAISTARLLRGVKGQELLEWASRSGAATRLLVQALESQVPSKVVSTGLRGSGLVDRDLMSTYAGPPKPRSLQP